MEYNEISKILLSPRRKLVVASHDISLSSLTSKDMTKKGESKIQKVSKENTIFILMVEESSHAAGGRGGGSGNRRIDKIIGFNVFSNNIQKIYETEDKDEIEEFEIPYSAVAMDIIIEDGKQAVVQGIVDEEMINAYLKITKNCD